MSFYSPEFKRSIIEQLVNDPGKTLLGFSKETGIGRASLYRWMKKYGACSAGLEKRAIRPSGWGMAQKLRAILETQNLKEEALGSYLRKNGLFYSTLVEWKAEILDEVKKNKTVNTIPASEAIYLRKIRELESEIKMKDKALKEVSALLELKKKADLIWPEAEAEKSPNKIEE